MLHISLVFLSFFAASLLLISLSFWIGYRLRLIAPYGLAPKTLDFQKAASAEKVVTNATSLFFPPLSARTISSQSAVLVFPGSDKRLFEDIELNSDAFVVCSQDHLRSVYKRPSPLSEGATYTFQDSLAAA